MSRIFLLDSRNYKRQVGNNDGNFKDWETSKINIIVSFKFCYSLTLLVFNIVGQVCYNLSGGNAVEVNMELKIYCRRSSKMWCFKIGLITRCCSGGVDKYNLLECVPIHPSQSSSPMKQNHTQTMQRANHK